MRVWQLSLIVGGALIVLMWLATGPRSVPPAEEVPGGMPIADPAAIAPPSPPVAAPEQELPAALEEPEPKVAPGPATVRRPDAPEAETPELQVPPPTRGGFIDELRAAYASSSADGSAAAMESEIFDLVGEQPDLLTVDAVDCHATVCRIRMQWSRDQPTSYMALYMLLGQHVNEHMAVDPQGDPAQDDPLPLEVYLLRRGYDLSDL